MRFIHIFFALLGFIIGHAAIAGSTNGSGQVTVPLAEYQKWLAYQQQTQTGPAQGFALGKASADVNIVYENEQYTAKAVVKMPVEVLENEWTKVPLLPSTTAVIEVKANGNPVNLNQTADGYVWSVRKAGKYQLTITYHVVIP